MKTDINRADIDQLMLRAGGVLLYRGEEGCIVREKEDGAIISDILDGERLCAVLKELQLPQVEIASVKSEDAARAVSALYGFTDGNPCSQWVYCEPTAPVYEPADIRPLGLEHAKFVAAHYHLLGDGEETLAHIRRCIGDGLMWGVFDEGKIAGFIGLHSEGSMGMLEILPEYRRRGYAFALEAYCIDRHLKQGWTAFGQVIEGNGASWALQQKLGMRRADLPAIWIY